MGTSLIAFQNAFMAACSKSMMTLLENLSNWHVAPHLTIGHFVLGRQQSIRHRQALALEHHVVFWVLRMIRTKNQLDPNSLRLPIWRCHRANRVLNHHFAEKKKVIRSGWNLENLKTKYTQNRLILCKCDVVSLFAIDSYDAHVHYVPEQTAQTNDLLLGVV